MTAATDTSKIALVTGGNRGIGLEIVRQLGAQGITVYLAARHLGDAEKAAQSLQDMDIRPVALDVTDEETMYAMADMLERDHGVLDILVNNGGILTEGFGADHVTAEMFRESFEVNTIGPYMLTQTLTPLLEKSAAPRVVNQSSMMGSMKLTSDTPHNSPAYGASKAALNMVTIIQAAELAPKKIKVNACHPGWVKTRMGGENAQISVTEGAHSAVRLALLPDDGPTGGFFFLDDTMPW